jgi:hypothetical protein
MLLSTQVTVKLASVAHDRARPLTTTRLTVDRLL